jgi:hypothetical protein
VVDNWLNRELDRVKEEVRNWPEWMKRELGIGASKGVDGIIKNLEEEIAIAKEDIIKYENGTMCLHRPEWEVEERAIDHLQAKICHYEYFINLLRKLNVR